MIIFYAHPVREYPLLNLLLRPNYKQLYHFHFPLEPFADDFEQSVEDEIVVYPLDQKLPRKSCYEPNMEQASIEKNGLEGKNPADIEYLYGVFSKNRLDLKKDDFLFTFMKNPVDRLYDLYYFAKFDYQRAMEEGETIRSKNVATCIFSEFLSKSLEEFIDCFIENSGQIKAEFNGVKYYLVEQVYRSKNPVCYNFVGIVEKMEKSIEILNQILEINIPYRGRIARESSISKKETYRRKELENLLSIDLEVYHGYNDLVK